MNSKMGYSSKKTPGMGTQGLETYDLGFLGDTGET